MRGQIEAAPVARGLIATGERRVTRYEFRELLEKQACHVIQPDLCHCGGLWEAKKDCGHGGGLCDGRRAA